MGQVEFIGEGPSPLGIHREFEPGLPPPHIVERYPGEIAAMYRANGLESTMSVLVLDQAVTVQKIVGLMGVRALRLLEQQGARLGPYVDITGVLERGVSLWQPKTPQGCSVAVNSDLFTVN